MERIKGMDLPTEAFIIMINIVGFASDGVTLDNQTFVEETQSHYMNLLYRSVKYIDRVVQMPVTINSTCHSLLLSLVPQRQVVTSGPNGAYLSR